ncbi:hypothetical protein O181_089528 [Austropuccinia psidii MF-1]|uniref:Uncharacterized protein n=1 Tax=Austropuccinia psidii MF-1 TaxID=1389203 RepID=A0A9Q3P4W7_9BASI|nr:hypothetical protein [Austropuccinia psidii MF-1]
MTKEYASRIFKKVRLNHFVTTIKNDPPPLVLRQFHPGNQVGVKFPHHILYGQLAPSDALCPFGNKSLSLAICGHNHHLWPQAISCNHWHPLPIATSPTARPLYLFLGLGGPLRPKGAKGGIPQPQRQVGLKPQACPPEPYFGHQSQATKNGQNPIGPKLAMDHLWPTFQPMASGNHKKPPAQLNSILPLTLRRIPSIPPCTPYSMVQEWSQNPKPILKEESSDHQSGNPWWLSEDH